MDPSHEGVMERSCPSSASEEDAWWWLFKLLVPSMQGRDVDVLKMEYSPCESLSAEPSPLDSAIRYAMCLSVH